MTKLKIPDAFTNYAGVGCSISWIEDGFEIVASLVEDDIAKGERGEWCFMGMKIDVYRANILLVENGAFRWGLYPYGDCGAYLTDLAKKLSFDAITKAKENLPKLIIKILEISGLDDAIWCLRWLPKKHIKTVRLFTCDIAEHVLHLFEDEFPEDKRPSKAINTARLYAEGKCTGEELRAAWRASLKAAVTSASNAEAAPWAADAVTDASNAEAAAWAAYAAAEAAEASAYAAAEAAAEAAYAAAEAAEAAAYAAAEAAAEAAEAAAYAAAEAAAEAAADAASAWVAALRGVATKEASWCAGEAAAEAAANAARAAEAAEAAGKTTLKEEKMWQTELFIKYFG